MQQKPVKIPSPAAAASGASSGIVKQHSSGDNSNPKPQKHHEQMIQIEPLSLVNALHKNSHQSIITQPKNTTEWNSLPEKIWITIFTYLTPDIRDIRSCLETCKEWNRILSHESCDVWKIMCHKKITKSILKSDILSSLNTYKSKLISYYYNWNSNDCSRNIYIKSSGYTLHRNPVAQSTDAAKGKIGFRSGRHVWEIWWEGPLGTVAVIGVATSKSPLQASGYVPLLGSNCESWGWNLVDNHLLHNGDCHGSFPLQNNAPKYQTGERLRVILDSDHQTLSFERNYEFLGVAFRGLPKFKTLYPCVSAVYGNTEVTMVYLGPPLDG